MYHRNVIPAFVMFAIAILLAIVLGSFWWETQSSTIAITSAQTPIVPPTPLVPHSPDPLITPGPSGQ